MQRIVITAGPTRQYLDPVRYISNASSGKMGAALANAALNSEHEVIVVSGPVQIEYPSGVSVIPVISTEEMLAATAEVFQQSDGLIGAAAPCDYQPRQVDTQKIAKTGRPITLELVETPDIVAELAGQKSAEQWVVGFALETDDHRFRSIVKMQRKRCDLMVSNTPNAIESDSNSVEILAKDGRLLETISGSKPIVAEAIISQINAFIEQRKR